ncbi:MAG: D-alanine--D-alanine ligase [Nitrospirota bacterium]
MPIAKLSGKKIGVLMGGLSSEREISIRTGTAIAASLSKQGYTVCSIDVTSEIGLTLRQEKIDVAFIALHGRYGEDGTIQGLLEMMQIPYTGSGVLASALGMNKAASRAIFTSEGIATPKSQLLTETERESFQREPSPFGYPVVVKPISEGSSVGVSIVRDASKMAEALSDAFRFGPKILVEKYIAGREVHVGVLEGRALGVIEILPKTDFYDYTAKYEKGMSDHVFPANLPPEIYQRMLALGLKAHHALGCLGYSRADFILDKEFQPYLLEVNTLPGMTETSLIPEMARGAGISFDQLVEKILGAASLGK